ncbi:MAG: hypothetical protein ACLFTA_00235 [Candidatus Nanohaloarchaea archaeon]
MKDEYEEYVSDVDPVEALKSLEGLEGYRRDGFVIREMGRSYFDQGRIVAGLASEEDEEFGSRLVYDPEHLDEETIDEKLERCHSEVMEEA